MADENNEQDPGTGGRKRLLPIAIAAVAALLVGGLSGAFVAGPLLAKRTAPPAAAAPAPAGAPAEAEEEVGEPDDGSAYPIHTIENMVLNPAGSGGTRFLMVTVALELKSEAVAEEVKRRDPELRDVLLRVLGAKTVEQLADVTAREALKEELRDSTSAAFPRGAVRRLYLPQFVIQ